MIRKICCEHDYANSVIANAMHAFPKVVMNYLRRANFKNAASSAENIFEVIVIRDEGPKYAGILACMARGKKIIMARGMWDSSAQAALVRLLDEVSDLVYLAITSSYVEIDVDFGADAKVENTAS